MNATNHLSSHFEVMKNLSDESFNQIVEDFFDQAYSNPTMQTIVVLTYLIGWSGIAVLILVLWFERTGQAGHFRTLRNQLVSFGIDQVW